MSSFACPTCGGDTKVVDSRAAAGSSGIRRRRICDKCKGQITTYEAVLGEAPQFITHLESLMAKSAVVSHDLSTFIGDLERIVTMVRIYKEIQDATQAAQQADDPYDFWRRALAGEKVGGPTLPVHEDEPQPGFWRKRTGRAAAYSPVAIWRNDAGVMVGLLDGRETNPSDLWTYCCRHPVTEQQYRDRMATGRWWDEDGSVTESLAPPPIGHNQGDDTEGLKDQIEAALKGVGDYAEVKDDETAAKAQSLRSRLLELSRTADRERESKKRPHLEAGKAVDELFQPLVKAAKGGADTIAKALSAHETAKYRAEQARLAEERRKEVEEAARHAPIGAEPEPSPAPAPAPAMKISGAYGRAASVKLVKVAVVKDQDAAYAYLKAQPELVEVIQKLAQKAVAAGMTVPGVEIEEQRKVS